MDWSHNGTVMHYSQYVEPQDGAVSIVLLPQQETTACVQCIQKESHCCKGKWSVSDQNRECPSLSKEKMWRGVELNL
jgi:hypothetical protein